MYYVSRFITCPFKVFKIISCCDLPMLMKPPGRPLISNIIALKLKTELFIAKAIILFKLGIAGRIQQLSNVHWKYSSSKKAFIVLDRPGHHRHVEPESAVLVSKAPRRSVEEQSGSGVRPRVRPLGQHRGPPRLRHQVG